MANRKQQLNQAVEENIAQVNERTEAAAASAQNPTDSTSEKVFTSTTGQTANPKPKFVLHPEEEAANAAPVHPRAAADRLKKIANSPAALSRLRSRGEELARGAEEARMPQQEEADSIGKRSRYTPEQIEAAKTAQRERALNFPITAAEKQSALAIKMGVKKPVKPKPAAKTDGKPKVLGDWSNWKPGRKDPKIDRKGRK